MGMYTEFHFNAELKQNVHQGVIDVLRFMLGEIEKPEVLPNHLLFSTDRWEWMLRSDSYYFDADTHSTLRFDDISKSHYLCIRCNLKNYGDEIEKFVSWIMPYLDKNPGDFLGFSRYEEREQPVLIFMGELVARKDSEDVEYLHRKEFNELVEDGVRFTGRKI